MTSERKSRKKHSFFFYLWFVLKKLFELNPKLAAVYFLSSLMVSFVPQIGNFTIGRLVDKANLFLISGSKDPVSFITFLFIAGAVLLLSSVLFDFNGFINNIFHLRNQVAKDTVSYEAMLKAEIRYFDDPEFIKEKTKVDYNSWKITEAVGSVASVVTSIAAALVVITVFLTYDWKIVFVAVLSLLLPALVQLKFGNQAWGIWDSMSEEKIVYSNYRDRLYTDDGASFSEMKIFGYGKYLMDMSVKLNKKFITGMEVNEKRRLVFTFGSRVWEFVFVILGLYLVFLLFLTSRVSIGQFFFIVTLFQSLRSSVSFAIERSVSVLTDADIFETFYNFLNFEPTVRLTEGTKKIHFSSGPEIRFESVSFTYPGTRKSVLNAVNLHIPSGQNVALVGLNGAGKTTLIKLLLRIYDPTEGSIYLNGTNIKDLSLDDYYKQVGILSQNFVTINIKAWENIYVGETSQPYSEVRGIEAAKKARAHDFIKDYPAGYDTYLTRNLTNGIAPSGGQWQRIAIARVFYRDPSLIILDEPTSAIDAIAEEEIFSNIRDLARDKTVIIVSHRFATVRKADSICVIDEGKVIEQGTHAVLLSHEGLYSKMYNSQNN